MMVFFPLYAFMLVLYSPAASLKMVVRDQKPLPFITKTITVAGQSIIRSTPLIDGIITEGLTEVFTDSRHFDQFQQAPTNKPKASFRLNPAEGVEKALYQQAYSLVQNPYVEKIEGMYEPVWLSHFGELRPTFKVRPPTISVFDLKDIYVDAETGEILRVDDVAQLAPMHAPAHLFVYSPTSEDIRTDVKPVMLKNLVNIEENGFLQGQYINVRTCCKYYVCPDDGPCTDREKRCAHKSHSNAQQNRELLELPTQTLGLDPLLSMAPTLTVDTVRCTYLPFAKAGFKNSNSNVLGFFDAPIDDSSPESEMDRFSEIQAYFSMSSFFNHIRTLLDDPTWCLRKEAMLCNKDGSPVLDDNKRPKKPYNVFVNQMIPDMKIDSNNQFDEDNFLSQIKAGKGTPDNPIKLDQFARIGNAAFIPALSTLKSTTPRADEILSDLIKPYDHNVFFQGDRDFAYDGDVVFHEFMHAITTSLISKINTLGLDKWGINSEPGGLNEGWADYFSASFTNKPGVGEYASTKDGFGETSLRNIDNTTSCPHDVIGESHHDSLIWSGALWEIRKHVANNQSLVLEFDRAVLASLAQATITEDFATQSQKLINSIRSRPQLGEKLARLAEDILDKRGLIDCFRAYTLSAVDETNQLSSRSKNFMFIASKNQIGLKNYAPGTMQLEIGIPAGATHVTVSWRQFLAGTGALLGSEVTPKTTKNAKSLEFITSLEVPIVWKFSGAHAIALRGDENIGQTAQKAIYQDGSWRASIPLSLAPCDQKTMYLSFLSSDFKYVLENIQVSFVHDKTKDLSACDFAGNRRITKIPPFSGCSQKTEHIDYMILMALLLLVERYRRYNLC